MRAIEAAEISNVAAIAYSKRQLFTYSSDQSDFVPVPGKVALYRDATSRSVETYLGVVHENFPVLSNRRLAEILEPLSENWPIETVGALGDGDTVFFTLQSSNVSIAGDECRQFFVLVDYKTPGKALRLLETKVRIVCENTLMAALGAASMSITIPHQHGRFEANTAFYIDLRDQMVRAQVSSTAMFEQMAATPIARLSEQLGKPALPVVVNYVFPTPTAPPSSLQLMRDAVKVVTTNDALNLRASTAELRYERDRQAAIARQTDVLSLYERFNDEYPRAAGSAWALYNAVAEYADHRVGFKENYTTAFRGADALFGKRAGEKERALRALTESVVLVKAATAVPV